MYYRDPDGGKVELQIDNYDNAQAMHDFMRSPQFEKNPIGVDFDPDELARGYHAGKPQSELTATTRTRASIAPASPASANNLALPAKGFRRF